MTRLLVTGCTFVLGTLGWYAGEPFGMFTAFILSIVGTAAACTWADSLADRWGV